jgi:hypothetical protein
MFRDKVIEGEFTKTFFYKCPNPNCENYGYKKEVANINGETVRGEQE